MESSTWSEPFVRYDISYTLYLSYSWCVFARILCLSLARNRALACLGDNMQLCTTGSENCKLSTALISVKHILKFSWHAAVRYQGSV